MPDPSQVTAVATQPPVAVRLTIYFQPSDRIKSLLHSSINTVSAARDSNSWVDLLLMGRDVCNDKVQQEKCFDWWKHCCYTPDTMDIPGSQCNVGPNRLTSSFYSKYYCISYFNLSISLVFKGGYTCQKSIFIDTTKHSWTSNL